MSIQLNLKFNYSCPANACSRFYGWNKRKEERDKNFNEGGATKHYDLGNRNQFVFQFHILRHITCCFLLCTCIRMKTINVLNGTKFFLSLWKYFFIVYKIIKNIFFIHSCYKHIKCLWFLNVIVKTWLIHFVHYPLLKIPKWTRRMSSRLKRFLVPRVFLL